MRNCPRRNTEAHTREPVAAKKEKTERSVVKCYNCGKRGHIAMNCPDHALLCDEGIGCAATRKGKVEGKEAKDILLDTGCSRTMVQRGLVPEGKILEGEAVTVRCAHGDMVLYPLAEVELELDGAKMKVKAAVSDTLPVSVLLGTDVPELGRLLRANPSTVRTEGVEEALVVTTRAQQKKKRWKRQSRPLKKRCRGQSQTHLRCRKRRLSRKETSWRKCKRGQSW